MKQVFLSQLQSQLHLDAVFKKKSKTPPLNLELKIYGAQK